MKPRSIQRESATFTVVHNAQLSARATLSLASNDATEGTASPANLAFETSTWNVPQTVAVTGVDDTLLDGDLPFGIVTSTLTSTDPNYLGLAVPDVAVTNTDNDSAGVTVPSTTQRTSEFGAVVEFPVVLNAAPTADVVIDFASSDLTEGTVSPARLTFTVANWASPQRVSVTGVDDPVPDGPGYWVTLALFWAWNAPPWRAPSAHCTITGQCQAATAA